MKHSHLLGNLPTRKSGMLNRTKAAIKLGISAKALHKGYNNWCQTFRMVASSLTLEQYFNKLREAGITVFDLGNRNGDYQLARYNDEGPYTNESCRFVRMEVNSAETKRIPPFELMVVKFGYETAVEHNRRNGHAGKGKKQVPHTTEHRAKISRAVKASWRKRKLNMINDGKRVNGPVTLAAKGQDF